MEKICRKWRFKPKMKEWRGVVSVVSPYRVPISPFADQGLICRSRVSAFSFTVSRQILVDWCMSPLVGETKNLTKFAIWRSLHHDSGLLFHAKFHVDRCIASPWGVKKNKNSSIFSNNTLMWRHLYQSSLHTIEVRQNVHIAIIGQLYHCKNQLYRLDSPNRVVAASGAEV